MDDIERIERRLKLHDMRVLIAVVEAGSMHKAAERLRTSQPAISRSISDLEQSIGVRLLDRSPRGIRPTPYGRVLVKRGVAAFDEFRHSRPPGASVTGHDESIPFCVVRSPGACFCPGSAQGRHLMGFDEDRSANLLGVVVCATGPDGGLT